MQMMNNYNGGNNIANERQNEKEKSTFSNTNIHSRHTEGDLKWESICNLKNTFLSIDFHHKNE